MHRSISTNCKACQDTAEERRRRRPRSGEHQRPPTNALFSRHLTTCEICKAFNARYRHRDGRSKSSEPICDASQLQGDIGQLREQVHRMSRLLLILEGRNQQLNRRIDELEVNEHRSRELASAFSKRCQQMETMNGNLQATVARLNQACGALRMDKERLHEQVAGLADRLDEHDSRFAELWARISKSREEIRAYGITLSVLDQSTFTAGPCAVPEIVEDLIESTDQPREDNTSSAASGLFVDEPVPPDEEAYYEKCKQYHQLARMPIVSVSDDLFTNESELLVASLVFVIDVDKNDFDAKLFLRRVGELFATDDIVLRSMQTGCVKLVTEIYKKVNGESKKIQIKALYDSLTDLIRYELGKLKVIFMFMGDIHQLKTKQELRYEIKLHPESNRVYREGQHYWTGALTDGLDRGNQPYYCPVGWRRYSLYVTDRFYERFQGWCICYHGTKFTYGLSILLSGLMPAKATDHGSGIYVSPSIIYASHPRYAEVKEIDSNSESDLFKIGSYIQFVLQCRVHPSFIRIIGPETLQVQNSTIDPNISNDKIEWVVDAKEKLIMDFNDPDSTIICTGLMIRVTDHHPGLLPESEWWYRSHLCAEKDNPHCLLGIDLDDLNQQKREGVQCTIQHE